MVASMASQQSTLFKMWGSAGQPSTLQRGGGDRSAVEEEEFGFEQFEGLDGVDGAATDVCPVEAAQHEPGACETAMERGDSESATTEGLEGFDVVAGQTWIYPTNYPLRDYQYHIVQKALFCNCLVCLPTGLGKTFIAAVVMLNFYRWYPNGRIVFLAPTKPLVAQQLEACHRVAGLPQRDAAEMTGRGCFRHVDPWCSRSFHIFTSTHTRSPPQAMRHLASEHCCGSRGVYSSSHPRLLQWAVCCTDCRMNSLSPSPSPSPPTA